MPLWQVTGGIQIRLDRCMSFLMPEGLPMELLCKYRCVR